MLPLSLTPHPFLKSPAPTLYPGLLDHAHFLKFACLLGTWVVQSVGSLTCFCVLVLGSWN